MKKIMAVVVFCFSSVAFAEESKRESVESLLQVTKVDAMVEAMHAQIDQLFVNMGRQMGIKPSEQDIFDRYMKNVSASMQEDMTWEKMKEPIIEIYLKHFSEEEIQDMLAFYQTQSGQSLIKKMPLVMSDSMLISQNMMQDFVPKMRQLSIELHQELEERRKTH